MSGSPSVGSPVRSVTFERRLAGAPEDAFAYFTDPAKHVQWQGIKAELDPRPGGAYVVHISPNVRIAGRYAAVEFPRRLVLEWGLEVDAGASAPPATSLIPARATTVEITFVADGEETLLRLVHSGLAGDDAAAFTGFGWTHYMARLEAVAAGQEPPPDPFTGAP